MCRPVNSSLMIVLLTVVYPRVLFWSILFTVYKCISIVFSFGILNHHFYAYHTQVYVSITPETADHSKLQDCLITISQRRSSNKLRRIPNKTEFMFSGIRLQKQKFSQLFPIDILGGKFYHSEKVGNLGVIFDSGLSLDQHISSVCQSTFYHIRNFSRIRKYLSLSTMKSFTGLCSRSDYCNSLFHNLCSIQIKQF